MGLMLEPEGVKMKDVGFQPEVGFELEERNCGVGWREMVSQRGASGWR